MLGLWRQSGYEVSRWRKGFPDESSLEVRFFWEAAACSLDDDVGSVVCRLHTLIQRFLLDKLRQETCVAKKEASTIKINRRLKTEANRLRHKNSNTGASYLLRRHRLHRLCQQCIWGQFSLQGKFQSCHLERRGEKHFTSTQGQERVKQMPGNGGKKEGNITLSHNRFILPLSNNYNPLSLLVVFG